MDRLATWDGLAAPWRLAFEEAWASFQDGNFGIGAVLVDPADGDSVVSVGRNRVAQAELQTRTLSGNMTAHAEMNAFASLDRFNADGLHLYTTLEPCLMCAATAMQLKVEHVHFAAADEFYAGMNDLWKLHPVTAERQPASTGPMLGPLADFARLLPMVFTLKHFPGRAAEQLARQQHPALAALTDRLGDDVEFVELTRAGSVTDALGFLWGDLGA
jgi:tRNA(Arg) A34 adenosine deaminase TadA